MDCNFAIDNITLRDVMEQDLGVRNVTADLQEIKVSADNSVKISVAVENRGTGTITGESYTIVIKAADKTVATLAGVALTPYQRENFTYDWKPGLEDAGNVTIEAEAVYNADMHPNDNVAEGPELIIRKPEAPAVTDLLIDDYGSEKRLVWSRPDQSGRPVEYITDSFEEYRNQSINQAGDWTILDRDMLPTSTGSFYFPAMGSPVGFIVMNTDEIPYDFETTLSKYWPANSGSSFLASFAAQGGDNDDWLITPMLSGNAQTIEFYAKSASEEYGHESIEIWASADSTDPDKFTKLTTETIIVPSEWTRICYDIPENTKYVAVRCVSHNRLGLFIDDFRYESAARPLQVTFLGYNVYCNGTLINQSPIDHEWFILNPNQYGDYTVRVLYDLGETNESNTVSYKHDAINIIERDGDDSGIWYDMTGRRIKKPTRPGIYIHGDHKTVITSKATTDR